MKSKRTFALLLTAIMLFSLTACSGTKESAYDGLWKPVSFEIDGKTYSLSELQDSKTSRIDDGFRITLNEDKTAVIQLSNEKEADNEIETSWAVTEGTDTSFGKIKVNAKECSLNNGQLVYQYDDNAVITLEKLDVFSSSLSIMGKGMLGIFATIIIVMIVVFLLSKTGKKKDAE